MDLNIPPKGWLVFTKSNCSYCTKAKDLLPDANIILCDTYLKECRDDFLASMDSKTGVQHRTFPMIFHDGKFIGGYTNLVDYKDELEAFESLEL